MAVLAVKSYSVSISLSHVLYKLTNVICYYSFFPFLTPQWPDSVPISVLYQPNLSPVRSTAVICMAVPIYRYSC